MVVPPNTSIPIYLSGELPNSFSSGDAIIHVPPIDPTLSILTTQAEFVNQTTCFLIMNKGNKTQSFPIDTPFAYFDARSIGHYNSVVATQLFQTNPFIYPSLNAALSSETSPEFLEHSEPPVDTQDPYP